MFMLLKTVFCFTFHVVSMSALCWQDRERQPAQIGIMVEFAIALVGKLDGINRHSFNNFRLRVGEWSRNTHTHTHIPIDRPVWSVLYLSVSAD